MGRASRSKKKSTDRKTVHFPRKPMFIPPDMMQKAKQELAQLALLIQRGNLTSDEINLMLSSMGMDAASVSKIRQALAKNSGLVDAHADSIDMSLVVETEKRFKSLRKPDKN